MRTSIKYLISVSFLIATISGCKKGAGTDPDPVVPDTTKPTITIIRPTAGQSFVAGNTIMFQTTFSDNIELKSYEIMVSKVLTGGLILKVVPVFAPFSYSKSATSFSAGVKQQEVNLSDIVIPVNTATAIITPGKYNLKVICFDTSNNSSETTMEININ